MTPKARIEALAAAADASFDRVGDPALKELAAGLRQIAATGPTEADYERLRKMFNREDRRRGGVGDFL